jgi:hypothetical protein
MASNFKILVHRKSDKLHLTLEGDFDGTSACELLNLLEEECSGAGKVLIDTAGLKEIYPFGRDTFQNNLYLLKSQRICLAFTGKNATQIAPERNRILSSPLS